MVAIAKKVLPRTLRMARGTATMIGIAVMLALTVGLASTALAGTGIGARFDLGKINIINDATTQLVGSVRAPMLTIANQNDGKVCGPPATERLAANSPGEPPPSPLPQPCTTNPAPALGLTVRPGQTPLTVNSDAGTAKNLSADKLDGKDSTAFAGGTNGKANDANLLDGKDSTAFVDPTKIYTKSDGRMNDQTGEGAGAIAHRSVSCDPGDAVLGGGGFTTGDGQSQDTLVESSPNGSNGWAVIYRDGGTPNVTGVEVRCADLPPLR